MNRILLIYHLWRKEMDSFFATASGWTILGLWTMAAGAMLWLFGGDYNLLDGGTATLRPFFRLAPVLLMCLVPAVTMRLYAEERRSGTLELLFTHPVSSGSILIGKFLAAYWTVVVALFYTLFYVILLAFLAPQGMDVGEIVGGYVGLLLLGAAYCAVGLFASACSRNQVTACLSGIVWCFLLYYGGALVATLMQTGALHNAWEALGMQARMEPMTRGMLTSDGVVYFFSVTALFLFAALCGSRPGWKPGKTLVAMVLGTVLLNLFATRYSVRWDLTADKRYTPTATTRNLMASLSAPVEVTLYLNGDLNPQFHALRRAAIDFLTEMAGMVPGGVSLKLSDPNRANGEEAREENYRRLNERGITPLSVNQRNPQDGRITEQIVFPWAEVAYEGDTMAVPLLRRNLMQTPQEVLLRSAGELEYAFSDALRILAIRQPERIAFIEGHGEMTEPSLYQAFNALSKYYSIDSGVLGDDPEMLKPYKALVIADPKQPFTEVEKFVLDQYLMQGGSLMLLTSGCRFDEDMFGAVGTSPTLKRDLNLDDMLFSYGVRIEPALVQDLQCTPIVLTSTTDQRSTTTLPWFFAPLLLPSEHALVAHAAPLKSEYVSPLTLVNAHPGVEKQVLLTTSAQTHLLPVPEAVSLRYAEMPADEAYFNEPEQVAAVLIEGELPSAYRNRPVPEQARLLSGGRLERADSAGKEARILVASSGSLLRGEWEGSGKKVHPLPLGYDAPSRTTLGNEDFLIRSLTYLTRQEEWIALRGRTLAHYPIAPGALTRRLPWQLCGVLSPLALVLLSAFAYRLDRKRRYYSRTPKH